MIDFADRPNRWPWPPIILVATLVAGFVMGWLLPLPSLAGAQAAYATWLGLLLLGSALLIDLSAILTLRRHKTQVLPHKAAEHLVTSGPFAMSRNPIYVGNVLLTIGIGLFTGQTWLLLLALPAAYAVQKLAIEREETHLAIRFGADWESYSQRVRRWL